MKVITAIKKVIRSLKQDGFAETGKLLNYHIRLRINHYVHLKWEKSLKSNCLIAVQVHLYYTDLLEEVAEKLNAIPYAYDLYISTDTDEKRNEIEAFFMKHHTARTITVQVFPNKGRDVVPMLLQMKNVFSQYVYFLHIHTKKTLTDVVGDIWRNYLYHNLLGSEDIVRNILFSFENNKKLGIVFPDFPYFIDPVNISWTGNKPYAEQIYRRWGFTADLPEKPVFAAGDMFWGRTKALRQVFEYEYSETDFPEENGQRDGTLMHAIERLWVYVAQGNGFIYGIVPNKE